MAKKSTKSKRINEDLSLSLAGANGPATSLSYDTQINQERPQSFIPIIARCRSLVGQGIVPGQSSSFLETYLPLKMSFWNSGFSIVQGPLAKGDQSEALTKWLESPMEINAQYTSPTTQEVLDVELNMTTGEAIYRFVKNAWREYLLLDNVVVLWMDDGRQPAILPPEYCRYIDTLGLQILYYTHRLSFLDIERYVDKTQQARFKERGEILINPKFDEHFKVLKRGPDGTGFARPRLFSLFRTLGEIDSKEVGFHARAFLMRAATRQHKIGHEITNGAHAGKPTHFWNKKRDAATRAAFKDRTGPHDFSSNFDHEIDYPWPEIAAFDEQAWKGTNLRLMNWGGAIAQMMLADKVSEGALSSARTLATTDRLDIANFILPAVKASFKAPDALDIKFRWSDLCFIDPAKATELVKFSVSHGLSSNKTAQSIIGLNPDEEAAQKALEAADPAAREKLLPMWDAAHGMSPALGDDVAAVQAKAAAAAPAGAGTGPNPGKTNGRPAGSKAS